MPYIKKKRKVLFDWTVLLYFLTMKIDVEFFVHCVVIAVRASIESTQVCSNSLGAWKSRSIVRW